MEVVGVRWSSRVYEKMDMCLNVTTEHCWNKDKNAREPFEPYVECTTST